MPAANTSLVAQWLAAAHTFTAYYGYSITRMHGGSPGLPPHVCCTVALRELIQAEGQYCCCEHSSTRWTIQALLGDRLKKLNHNAIVLHKAYRHPWPVSSLSALGSISKRWRDEGNEKKGKKLLLHLPLMLLAGP